MAVASQYSHYAEPTIATSLKDHPKPQPKPSKRQPFYTTLAIHRRPRSPNNFCHKFPMRINSRPLPIRTSVSDDEADRSLKRPELGPGRLSYSDDEQSIGQQSAHRHASRCARCLRRQQTSSSQSATESAVRLALTQSRSVPVQREGSPRPGRHDGCYACGSSAALR